MIVSFVDMLFQIYSLILFVVFPMYTPVHGCQRYLANILFSFPVAFFMRIMVSFILFVLQR